LEFGDVGFKGGKKQRARQEPTTNSAHIWHWLRIGLGPSWWMANALTTAPTLLPQLHIV